MDPTRPVIAHGVTVFGVNPEHPRDLSRGAATEPEPIPVHFAIVSPRNG